MIVLLAAIVDVLAGEPPNRLHPVAWIGRLLGWAYGVGPREGRAWPALFGTLVTVGGGAAVALIAAGVSHGPKRPEPLRALSEAVLLKLAFSVRGLVAAAHGVASALDGANLELARARVGRDLVSRETAELDAAGVASATIESLAENLTDSVVAPLAWYLAGGLPAAWAYRAINTADAMVGYRDRGLEYLGKTAARLDDALNFVPARIAACGILAGAALAGGDARAGARVMLRDHGRTASPNAGWTMAAMAGALGVTLEKRGAYRLGDGDAPAVDAIHRAIRIVSAASAVVFIGVLLTGARSPRKLPRFLRSGGNAGVS